MPDCERKDECRIDIGPWWTTAMWFQPIYDGYGRNINPDRNVSSAEAACSTCGKRWRVSRVEGETTWTEQPPTGAIR